MLSRRLGGGGWAGFLFLHLLPAPPLGPQMAGAGGRTYPSLPLSLADTCGGGGGGGREVPSPLQLRAVGNVFLVDRAGPGTAVVAMGIGFLLLAPGPLASRDTWRERQAQNRCRKECTNHHCCPWLSPAPCRAGPHGPRIHEVRGVALGLLPHT